MPYSAGPPGGAQREYVISVRDVPKGLQRARALELGMRHCLRQFGGQVTGFACGRASTWGSRREVVVWTCQASGGNGDLDRCFQTGALVDGCQGQVRCSRLPPLGVTQIVLHQLPRELCCAGFGACLLAAAGVVGAEVVAEFHPQVPGPETEAGGAGPEASFADTSRAVIWVRRAPGAASAPALHRLPAAFQAGARTVRVRVGWPEAVTREELPGKGAADAAVAGRPSPPPAAAQPASHSAPGRLCL